MSDHRLLGFIVESNMIEGIERPPKRTEVLAHERLFARSSIDIIELEAFVHAVTQGEAHLRRRVGADVYIAGSHAQIAPGGPAIEKALRRLLAGVNDFKETPHSAHVAYELLHPFEDGNGRSGRALWAWMMQRSGHDPFVRMFLHTFYYQTLDAARQ